ncbi:gp31 [Alphaproteobacteria phage PhiJL001]|uniref:Gp31 n=1 Tax=Alphaproteobacteria phage PhiJL001 TaxID=2681607 RepID=Q5DN74_9CAUD|nr:DNA helicase [Alphaproteobacteria phage PhiJL001]AAT69507.1 gp31 [Alphaproteobacteria phage PhiJL001]
MSEAGFWSSSVKPALFGWDPIRIETPDRDGTPDVNHIHGWLELKQVDSWPVREDTPLRVEHYTPQQRVWHKRRCLAGGRCQVLIKVKNDILLLNGRVASDVLGHLSRGDLIKHAVGHWTTRQKWKKELKNAILSDRPDRQLGLFDSR